MIRLRAIAVAAVFFSLAHCSIFAQAEGDWDIESPNGVVTYSAATQEMSGTNGVIVRYNNSVLTGEQIRVNRNTGLAIADGQVRIYTNDVVWAGEHIEYNFKTGKIVSTEFRTGNSPIFAQGRNLDGELSSNRVATATGALITTDDIENPMLKVRARHIRIIGGKRIEATHAVLYLGDVPVFYFPYYERNLGQHANNFTIVPGYRSRYGPFVLGTYRWFFNPQLDGEFHTDYRELRGPGIGPDINYRFGRWGSGTLRYYYTHDDDASTNFINSPVYENRQRLYFSYQAEPFTNVEVKALARYESDAGVVRDFFEGEYRQNPQPNTFFNAEKFWSNFSLDAYAQPRVNEFYETVERLLDIRLTGFRQQIGESPFYYESESSAGYYRRLFAETNFAPTGLNFEAARADTYHQITLPVTLFGWLNFIPRVGGRATYYSEAEGSGATTRELTRAVLNTGAEITFKASRTWTGVRNEFLDLDGVRHIIEPSVNYVFVPKPNYRPNELPQFDYELPSLRMLPIEYPDYNAIDSIDSQNVLRFGLRNRLQTKRDGQLDDFLRWEIFTDWRLSTRTNQLAPQAKELTFSDLYSDLTLKPRSWIRLDSQARYDLNDGQWRMLLHTVTLEPNDKWSWTIGHFYLRNEVTNALSRITERTGLGQGNNIILSSLFYRLNENWGVRANHHFDVRNGRMQEQFYTIYRDLRSWTAAVTGGVRDNGHGPKDYTIALTFSLKASPKYPVGGDTVRPYSLLGR